jgi:hypothetical protein
MQSPMRKMTENIDAYWLTIRIKPAEAARFIKLFKKALEKEPGTEKTDLIREILGLDSPNLLTEEDIEFFRSGVKNKDLS